MVDNTIQNAKDNVTQNDFEGRLKKAMDKDDEKELKKVCEDFESILLSSMYKQMKATIPKSDLIPGDMGKDIFDSMLDDKLIEEASKSNSVGLSALLYKQLSKQLQSIYKPVNGGETTEIVEEE